MLTFIDHYFSELTSSSILLSIRTNKSGIENCVWKHKAPDYTYIQMKNTNANSWNAGVFGHILTSIAYNKNKLLKNNEMVIA